MFFFLLGCYVWAGLTLPGGWGCTLYRTVRVCVCVLRLFSETASAAAATTAMEEEEEKEEEEEEEEEE